MRKQHVIVGDVSISMEANRGDFKSPTPRFLIKCLDVFEHMLEDDVACSYFVCRESVKHNRVFRIRRMRNRDNLLWFGSSLHFIGHTKLTLLLSTRLYTVSRSPASNPASSIRFTSSLFVIFTSLWASTE